MKFVKRLSNELKPGDVFLRVIGRDPEFNYHKEHWSIDPSNGDGLVRCTQHVVSSSSPYYWTPHTLLFSIVQGEVWLLVIDKESMPDIDG